MSLGVSNFQKLPVEPSVATYAVYVALGSAVLGFYLQIEEILRTAEPLDIVGISILLGSTVSWVVYAYVQGDTDPIFWAARTISVAGIAGILVASLYVQHASSTVETLTSDSSVQMSNGDSAA